MEIGPIKEGMGGLAGAAGAQETEEVRLFREPVGVPSGDGTGGRI